jgi:nucleoside-diphosphate-sugar epimerase
MRGENHTYMRRVVVTGGAGFIGSHLAGELADKGYNVVILDDLSTGHLDNIKDLLKRNNVSFVNGSITDLPLLKEQFKDTQYVFHHAASISVPESTENPQLYNENNIAGTLNVLIAAKDNSVSKVIFASSCAVYGDTSELPITEANLPDPLSPYAITKLTGEYYCKIFANVYNLPTVCFRYFNVYGPRQSPESQYAAAIPKFIKKAINNESPIIYGDGEQTRDFVFIRDIVSANILAAQSNVCGIYNVASGESVSINEVSDSIISLTGNKLEPVFENRRSGDIRDSAADITKAAGFGYKPEWTIEKGLKIIIAQYQLSGK